MEEKMLKAVVVVAAFVGMEVVAWITHKYVMHGILWTLHKDHHHKESSAFLERNDFFFLIFALPGLAAIYWGSRSHFNLLFWGGIGITIYGVAYFLIHDVFIHQRLTFFRKTDNRYLRALRKAHKMHHKHLGKGDGECFGMLWVPFKYFRTLSNKKP